MYICKSHFSNVYVCTYNLCTHVRIRVRKFYATVISEPDDVTVCEGGSTTFTCVLQDNNISSNDVQWYRLLRDTGTSEMVDIMDVLNHTNNSLTTSLTITNTIKSYTGYYWVRLPSDDVCNVSLTVLTSTYICMYKIQIKY